MPTRIPYAPGRDAITRRIVTALNNLATFIPVTPAEIAAMAALYAAYPTLLQSQPYVGNAPAGFIPWKLGTPATQKPIPSTAIIWRGIVNQTGAAAPTLTEATATGLIITKGRTSSGIYPLTGFPTGYSIYAFLSDTDVNLPTAVTVLAQTVTVKSYDSAGNVSDGRFLNNPLAIILVP